MSDTRRSPAPLILRSLSVCLFAAALLAGCGGRPAIKPASPESLRRAVCYLASDSLEGRLVGTPGIDRAAAYIADEMAALGLKPLFGDSYFQDFTVDFGFEIERTPIFRIGDAPVDYSVLPISGSGAIWAGAVIARDLTGAGAQQDSTGVAGKVVFLIEDPTVERERWTVVGRDGLLAWMRDEAQRASDLRASAIVFVSGSGGAPVKDHGSEGQAPEAAPGEGFHIFAVPRKYDPAAIPCLEMTYSQLQRTIASQGILFEDFHRAIEGDTARAWTEIKGLRCEMGIATRPKVVGVRNVGGLLEGCASKGEYVVVGAHFDGLGRGDISSATPWRREVYPGADDNASGAGAMLEIAREVAPLGCLERSVAFVAFTAEEMGAVGSEYFCNHSPYPLDSTAAMINLDTVGRLENRQLIVFGAKSALELGALIKKAERATKLKTVERQEIFGFSDQNPFYAGGIPSMHLFTGAHSDYHTPDDVCAKVNFPGLAKVSEFGSRLLLEIANSPVKLTPVEAPESWKASEGSPTPGGRGGFLGIVPDFAYAGEGVGIKGTMPKSPAEAAGLREGDVLAAVDGKPLVDLKQLMMILSEKAPGDEIALDVLRGGSRLTVRATIGVRASD